MAIFLFAGTETLFLYKEQHNPGEAKMGTASDQTLPPAKPAGLSAADIEEIASHLNSSLPTMSEDPYAVASYFGCEIEVCDTESFNAHGTVEIRGRRNWTVYLPSNTGPVQDRFTLAHELGHYILHSRMGSVPLTASRVLSHEGEPSIVEAEADGFALAFLMPRDKVKESVAHYGNSAERIAAVFQVSRQIAQLRINTLVE